VAVCCVPNAGRITPYFIRSMWMKDADGLVATLTGPNELQTTVNGGKVRIIEETNYPFGSSIQYHVTAEAPIAFTLKIRKPSWSTTFRLNCDYSEKDGYIIINKTWNGTESIRLDLLPVIEVKQDRHKEYYYNYGALVFALPIESREIISAIFPIAGFHDLKYEPVNLVKYQYTYTSKPEIVQDENLNSGKNWQSMVLKTKLINVKTGKPEPVALKPLGATILRQLTFCPPNAYPSTGSVKRYADFPSKYVDPRNVDVWLPDGYDPIKKYSVVYMHDGQMLFDSTNTWNKQEWGVEDVMGRLMAEKKIRNCIVIGIWNNGAYRHSEYFPQKIVDQIPTQTRAKIIHQQLHDKPQSDNYLKFIVRELKPFIDSSFSTLPDRANTFVLGSSMGGLISLYALCEYPEVFGGAACLSIHSPVAAPELVMNVADADVAAKFRDYLRKNLPKANTCKIYFDYGSKTLDSLYKPYQVKLDQIMREKGYTSKYWVTREFPGEDHSERAWSRRLEVPVEFLLGK